MITSNIKYCKRYFLNEDFRTAFTYLLSKNLGGLAEGKTIINKNIYINKDIYTTKPVESSSWEAHRKYIDIQYIHSGNEKIGFSSINVLDEFPMMIRKI